MRTGVPLSAEWGDIELRGNNWRGRGHGPIIVRTDGLPHIREIKEYPTSKIYGPDLQVHGSGQLIQMLMEHDLVDEFWLKILLVTLGMGKRLFDKGTIPASYTLVDSKTSPSGVMIVTLKRAGELNTGSF